MSLRQGLTCLQLQLHAQDKTAWAARWIGNIGMAALAAVSTHYLLELEKLKANYTIHLLHVS
jgi:hypothetical protein